MAREQDFYVSVAEGLIQKLKEGTAPWQKPWKNEKEHIGFPMNPTTCKRYRGGNLLNLMAQERADPRWMTYRQADKEGGQVRKGEHGTPVIYWKFEEEKAKKKDDGTPVLDDKGQSVMIKVQLERPRAFMSYVFNAEQIDGLPPMVPIAARAWEPVERAEAILKDSGARIENKAQGRAFYRPSDDNIQEDGTKRFTKNGHKDGCFHAVGGTEAVRSAPVLIIAEGYATASSLSEVFGMGTVAAFDAGNVVSVAKALHEKYPDKPIVIAGDDDRHQLANPGRSKALQAAEDTGAQVVFPIFAPGEEGKQFTDFNDLATKSALGSDAVRRQVSPVIDRAIKDNQAKREQSKEQQRAQSR